MDEKEIDDLMDAFVNGTISAENKDRLFNEFRQFGLTDPMIEDIIATTHRGYGKPDDDGEIREI